MCYNLSEVKELKEMNAFGGSTTVEEVEPKQNREYKDSFFRYLFGKKTAMAELYEALFGESVETEKIEDITLSDVFYNNVRNDLAFRVNGKRVIVMLEHQSTVNENMPLRFLMYLGRTYEKIVPTNLRYQRGRLELDAPMCVVMYNGEKELPPVSTMRLSDSFPDGKGCLELEVTVYNVNYPHVKDGQFGELISGYSTFIDAVRRHQKENEKGDYIKEAIKECIAKGILVEELTNLGSEVINMLKEEYDAELARKVYGEEEREEGRKEGKAEGRMEERRELIERMRSKGFSESQIQELLK